MTVANLQNNLGTTQALRRPARRGGAVVPRGVRDASRTARRRSLAHAQRRPQRRPRARAAAALRGGAAVDGSRAGRRRATRARARLTIAGSLGIRAQRAYLLFRLGRREEAIALAAAAVTSLEGLARDDTAAMLAGARVLLGRMLIDMDRPRPAEPILSAALQWLDRLGADHPQRAEAACELARARTLIGAPRRGPHPDAPVPADLQVLGPRRTRSRLHPRAADGQRLMAGPLRASPIDASPIW